MNDLAHTSNVHGCVESTLKRRIIIIGPCVTHEKIEVHRVNNFKHPWCYINSVFVQIVSSFVCLLEVFEFRDVNVPSVACH